MRAVLLAATLCFSALPTHAAPDPRQVWDLTVLYPTPAAWEAERQAVAAELPALKALQETVTEQGGAAALRAALDRIAAVSRRVETLSLYAGALADVDTRDAGAQGRETLARALSGDMGAAIAWLGPAVLRMGAARIEDDIAAEPGLKPHAFRLRDILRRQPHTLGDEAEAVLAALEPVTTAGATAYNLLTNADIDWPSVTLPDGRSVVLNQVAYTDLREHADRAVRARVFDAFWGKLGQYADTAGATLTSRIQAGVTEARLRGYPSAVAASLARHDIPETVYRTLVAETARGLPVLHRYFRLRQRMLGLTDLAYYDIYPPLVALERSYPLSEAARLSVAAVAPLGRAYQAAMREGLAGRWMHAYPSEGKQSGAYQNGVWGIHPYVFMNYTGNYDSVSTLAHEWGHALHTLLANAAQPYETADYSLFLAEIASTANEFLLSDHLVAKARSRQEQLFYLGNELELIRGTFFRQAMFAEFELLTHDALQAGEALSGQRMTELYCGLLKRYHGADAGVMAIDPAYCVEWAYIPHFYRPFYVYQYATSIAASAWFTERLGQPGMRDKYLAVLKAGGADYPVPLLARAGLDMTSPEPYRALIRRMEAVMDRMEALLDKKS